MISMDKNDNLDYDPSKAVTLCDVYSDCTKCPLFDTDCSREITGD
jgi:hypothetical protein